MLKIIFQLCTVPDAAGSVHLNLSYLGTRSPAERACTGAVSPPETQETEGVCGERRGWDLLAACSSHLFPPHQTGAKWPPVSKWHSRVCRQTKAQEPAKGKRPMGSEAHATACLAAWPAACTWVDKRLTGHASVLAAVAFDGGSRRCSVGARAGTHVHLCLYQASDVNWESSRPCALPSTDPAASPPAT